MRHSPQLGGGSDAGEEGGVGGGLAELVEQQLDGLLALEPAEGAPKLPGELKFPRVKEDLLASGARGVQVDGRVDALVGKGSGQPQLHVAGALEFLEEVVVHSGSVVHQG